MHGRARKTATLTSIQHTVALGELLNYWANPYSWKTKLIAADAKLGISASSEFEYSEQAARLDRLSD